MWGQNVHVTFVATTCPINSNRFEFMRHATATCRSVKLHKNIHVTQGDLMRGCVTASRLVWQHLKGVTTQMKALNEYFLMVVFTHCCGTDFMFLQFFCWIWTERHGSDERVKLSTWDFFKPKTLFQTPRYWPLLVESWPTNFLLIVQWKWSPGLTCVLPRRNVYLQPCNQVITVIDMKFE